MANANNTTRLIAAPNLPISPVQFDQRFMDQYSNVLRLFFNATTNAVNAPKPHAIFYDTTTQTNPVASAANLVTYNSVGDSHRIYLGDTPSRITVAEAGVYNFQFSAQLDKTGGGADSVYIWFRQNGIDIPNSATKVVISGPNSEVVPSWNYLVTMGAGDYFELVWSSADANVVLAAMAASAPVPEVPSIIMTVTHVSNIVV